MQDSDGTKADDIKKYLDSNPDMKFYTYKSYDSEKDSISGIEQVTK